MVMSNPTLYEMVIENGARRILLAYTYSRNRATLLKVARAHAHALAALTGQESLTFGRRAADGATMDKWHLRWTEGRIR
jgi:hypothetical protein